jgi:hypothetical protein
MSQGGKPQMVIDRKGARDAIVIFDEKGNEIERREINALNAILYIIENYNIVVTFNEQKHQYIIQFAKR